MEESFYVGSPDTNRQLLDIIDFNKYLEETFSKRYSNSVIHNYFKHLGTQTTGFMLLWMTLPNYMENLKSVFGLISDEGFVDTKEDMIILWTIIADRWNIAEHQINTNQPSRDKEFDEDLKKMKELFLNNGDLRKISRIEFQTNKGDIAITNYGLLELFLTFVKEKKLKKFINSTPFNCDSDYIPKLKSGLKLQWIKDNLWPLFVYLKEETPYKDKSNAETYRFIYRFCLTCGVNWEKMQGTYKNNIPTSNPPDEYLKRTFIKLGLCK